MQQTHPALIETMRLADGQIALWPGHRSRLLASAQALGYRLDPAQIEQQVALETHRLNDLPRQAAWRVRLLLQENGLCTLNSSPLPDTPVPVQLAWASDALAGHTSPVLLDGDDTWRRHKSTHRPWFAAAQDWLQQHSDHFDLVFCDLADMPCEGSRCNLYVRDAQGTWLTPPASMGLLPGVQRQSLLAQKLVQEAPLSRHDLQTAPALRVSNALRGWLDARLS
ncbi:aminotransferase class IV [Castellaniella sp.]|uniref:aminotransferase class IV n=1 Tax=Castellaniella sp. TaxID=1955812 RepID=UPI002AFE478B|nr:aminotransferase class IV [Castellaniella sp.]